MKNKGKNLAILAAGISLLLLSGGCGTDKEEESLASSGNILGGGITISENEVQSTSGPDSETQGSILYVDTQGTSDIYSELNLVYQGDEKYKATIGLYRLTTLEGSAVAEGEVFFFEDEEMQVKGEIRIQDIKAVFTVTESEFTYLEAGDEFEFPEKR